MLGGFLYRYRGKGFIGKPLTQLATQRPLLAGSPHLAVTPSVTLVAARSWPTMESTPEHPANHRRLSMPRPSWD